MRKGNGDVLFAWPLASHIITAGWQYSDGTAHNAIDLRAATGTPVYAAEGGTVDWVQQWDGSTKTGNMSYGNLVRVQHEPYNGGKLQTYYAHLDSTVVVEGQTVREGELLGFAGNTGNSFGSHLHFEVRLNGVRYNPLNWLDSDFSVAGDHVRLGKYTSVPREDTPAGFEAQAIDVSVYQGDIDWAQVKAAGIYAAVIRAGYGRYIEQEDLKFRQNYTNARAAGMPVGVYWYSYAKTPEQAQQEADICLQVLGDRALQMPLYMDQEWADTPVANRTACAVAFLDRIRERHAGLVGYYTYTSYFASVDVPTIQAHADTIWLADYRQSYDKTIPRDMHQYSSSGTVPGISGRVDMNRLYRDFPGELEKEEKPVFTSDTLKIGPVSTGDRAAIRTLAESLAVAAVDDGDYIIVGPMSAGDRAVVSNKALALGLGCEDYTAPAEPEKPQEPEDKPQEPAVDLTEVLAALGRIEAAQEAQGQQLTAMMNKLAAAGAALV